MLSEVQSCKIRGEAFEARHRLTCIPLLGIFFERKNDKMQAYLQQFEQLNISERTGIPCRGSATGKSSELVWCYTWRPKKQGDRNITEKLIQISIKSKSFDKRLHILGVLL